jgi:hypothetical protein
MAPPAAEVEPAGSEQSGIEPFAVEAIQAAAELAADDFAGGAREQIEADGEADLVAVDTGAEMPLTPAHGRLGSEGVLRLRARHAEVRARISERIADPARQEELKAQAERLNPDTWVTDAEVSAGLEHYETVFEALRTAVGGQAGGRRNKGRRGGGQAEAAGPGIDAPAAPKTEDS